MLLLLAYAQERVEKGRHQSELRGDLLSHLLCAAFLGYHLDHCSH
jgi:hypothetical protein